MDPYNCSVSPPYFNLSSDQMYKTQKKLLYPVNVGRNVAREMAETHFLLASDIELYPSPNIVPQFLEMIAKNEGALLSKNPKVFPLSLFEVSANQPVPESKSQLQEMLRNGTALPFHKKLCPSCHNVPQSKEWQAANETQGLHVFHVGKRMGHFVHWEPIFIGTHAEPLYDERLSWEGKSDKMTQVFNKFSLILKTIFVSLSPREQASFLFCNLYINAKHRFLYPFVSRNASTGGSELTRTKALCLYKRRVLSEI